MAMALVGYAQGTSYYLFRLTGLKMGFREKHFICILKGVSSGFLRKNRQDNEPNDAGFTR